MKGAASEHDLNLPIGKEYPDDIYEICQEKVREFILAMEQGAELEPGAKRPASPSAPPSFILVCVQRVLDQVLRDPALGLNRARLQLDRLRLQWAQLLTPGMKITTKAKLHQAFRTEHSGWAYLTIVILTNSQDENGKVVCQGRWEFHQKGEVANDG